MPTPRELARGKAVVIMRARRYGCYGSIPDAAYEGLEAALTTRYGDSDVV